MIADRTANPLAYMLSSSFNRVPAQSSRSSHTEVEALALADPHGDEPGARWRAMLHDRDRIIERQAGVILARTRQLDVVCEELARTVHQLDALHTVLEAKEQRLRHLDQVATKYRGWLTGYDANLIYLQTQLTLRDQQIRELMTEIKTKDHQLLALRASLDRTAHHASNDHACSAEPLD